MKFTSKEIAKLLEGALEGPSDIFITGAAGLEDAKPTDISFVANPKYYARIEESKAGLVIVSEQAGEVSKPCIKVTNPQLAFTRILEVIAGEMNPEPKPGTHPSAAVSQK